MKPINILYSVTTSGVGGAELVMNRLIQGLDRKRFNPSGVVVLKKADGAMAPLWEKSGAKVYGLDLNLWNIPSALAKYQRIIDQNDTHIVHSFLYKSIQLSRLVRTISKKFSLITSPRTNLREYPPPVFWLDKLLRKKDEFCICESQASQITLIDRAGHDPARMSVIPNGVNLEAFQRDLKARDDLRGEWNVSPDTLVVGYFGRLSKVKGPDILLKAFASVVQENLKCKLVIAGSGEEREYLETLAGKLEVAKNVLFLGHRMDAPRVLSAFDLFVLPSRREGMPNSLLEAMATGLPFVAVEVDGVREIVSSEWKEALVPPGDVESLAKTLSIFLQDESKRIFQSALNKKKIADYSLRRMIAGYEEIYEKMRR